MLLSLTLLSQNDSFDLRAALRVLEIDTEIDNEIDKEIVSSSLTQTQHSSRHQLSLPAQRSAGVSSVSPRPHSSRALNMPELQTWTFGGMHLAHVSSARVNNCHTEIFERRCSTSPIPMLLADAVVQANCEN